MKRRLMIVVRWIGATAVSIVAVFVPTEGLGGQADAAVYSSDTSNRLQTWLRKHRRR